MSASNWAICPRCLDKAQREYTQAVLDLTDLYGKVSVEEFDTARDALTSPDPESFDTFREDYEIYGAETGTVKVSYSGHCSVCSLGLNFNEERPFFAPAEVLA